MTDITIKLKYKTKLRGFMCTLYLKLIAWPWFLVLTMRFIVLKKDYLV